MKNENNKDCKIIIENCKRPWRIKGVNNKNCTVIINGKEVNPNSSKKWWEFWK